jgi:glycosyltransferase involved in cell wall biosynthesis
MAVLAVVTSSPAGVEGGHLVIARALVEAANASGHDAHLIVTADYGFGRQTRSYLANFMTDVRAIGGRRVDRVVSLRYPSYAVRHPSHVCWLNHTMREYYDLWPAFSRTLSVGNLIKESVRRMVTHAVDRHLLRHHVGRVVAQSRTIQGRLAHDFNIAAEVVYPPPPQRDYRCDEYGDYIFAVSRLMPMKRLDLLIRAMADPAAARVRAVVAGEGESADGLRALATGLGVGDRVQFAGRIDDRSLLDHLAKCRAVYFAPQSEDYGFVTVEAFASGKAVVTCNDSGGPAELVADRNTGVVCDPTPASVAVAMGRLVDDRGLAEHLGAAALQQAATFNWPDVVRRLVA